MLNIHDSDFQISGQINNHKTKFTMTIPPEGHVTTASLPLTPQILDTKLPSIFKSECFNEDNKNFIDECKNTELGHLFEHILLEYLCLEKIKNGFSEATYEGKTKWDWKKEPIGTFHININVGIEDGKIVKKAFGKAVCLLKKITLN